jgi:hypothetical protein
MTGDITNIREYHTSPGADPVDTDKLAEEALMPDEKVQEKTSKS